MFWLTSPSGPDAGVVHQNIEATQPLDDLGHRGVDRWGVGDVAAQGQHAIGCAVRTAVQDRHTRTAPLEQRAVPAPIPLAPPVTTATSPWKSVMPESSQLSSGSTWIFGPGPAASGRSPASTALTCSRLTVAATSGRGSTAPLAYAAMVASRPGEPDKTPTAVTSLRAKVRVSTWLGLPASPM